MDLLSGKITKAGKNLLTRYCLPIFEEFYQYPGFFLTGREKEAMFITCLPRSCQSEG